MDFINIRNHTLLRDFSSSRLLIYMYQELEMATSNHSGYQKLFVRLYIFDKKQKIA